MPGYWSDEAREAARQRIFHNQPWIHSTGPQSEPGKQTASRNSTSFVNQIKKGLWAYLPRHKVFVRKDTLEGAKLLQVYEENNWLYGDTAFLINRLNQFDPRWLDRLI